MEIQIDEQGSGTNCLDCERYKILGEVCVIEHGKRFLWEFCKDFQSQVKLPEYEELMKAVKLDMAIERKRTREKKEKEIAIRKKEREKKRKEKLSLKRSRIAKKIWKERRRKEKEQNKSNVREGRSSVDSKTKRSISKFS